MRYLKKTEVQVPLAFLLISTAWIIFSDRFFEAMVKDRSAGEITQIQTVKGVFFVVIVSLLIHLMIKSSNRRLLRFQEEYKDLFCNTPDPMFVFDADTKKFNAVNKAAIEIYGYSAEEFSKLTISDLRSTLKKESCKGGKSNVYTHQKKSTETIICEETERAILFKNSSASLISAHDITELEEAKIELAQRENQLHLILNSITDGFFILNAEERVVKANEVFKQMVETPVNDVEGKKLLELFPSIKGSASYARYVQALRQHLSFHFETLNAASNHWFHVSTYPFDGGLSVFFRDITKEKENDLQNKRNAQNLAALINNTEDYIWSIDANFRYYTFNEPYEKGYYRLFKDHLWIGKVALNERQGKEHVETWTSLYQRALNGEKFAVDMNFLVEDEYIFTTVRFNPIYNAEKKVTGVGCFLQNITERKLHERKIEQQNKKLREIAFITSHEVRVPLANILGLAEVLDNEDPGSTYNRIVVQHIKTSADQLDKTIRNMVNQTVLANEG